MPIALDATYSLGDQLTGIGVYSREILAGLARMHPDDYLWCYRPHRYLASFGRGLPRGCRRRFFFDSWTPDAGLFHGLNQRLPRARARALVATFHDLFVMTGDYSTADFRARFTQQAREAARRASRIIAVSRFTARQVCDLLAIEPGRVCVIHHGVNFRPGADEVERSKREKLILSAGGLQKRKNTRRLIEAFAAVDAGWKLVLAGGVGYGIEEIRAALESSPRRADIEVTGWIEDSRLADLYSRASVFAFPSLDEGFGMPVVEAMARGVAVLTSNCSALPEVAGGAALLVDPASTEEIAEGLRRLTRDEDARRGLIRKGLDRAAEFDWADAVERTWRIYGELLR